MNRAFQCLNCSIHYSNTWFYLIVTIFAPNPYSWNEASWWRQSGYLRFSSSSKALRSTPSPLPWIRRCVVRVFSCIVPSLHETYPAGNSIFRCCSYRRCHPATRRYAGQSRQSHSCRHAWEPSSVWTEYLPFFSVLKPPSVPRCV